MISYICMHCGAGGLLRHRPFTPPKPIYTGEAVHTDPDGFHGRSYSAYLADTESEVEPDDSKCQCEEVKTYGMVCVTCGKPYVMKTTFTVNGSAGEWNGSSE